MNAKLYESVESCVRELAEKGYYFATFKLYADGSCKIENEGVIDAGHVFHEWRNAQELEKWLRKTGRLYGARS